jgi:hypothetical protein
MGDNTDTTTSSTGSSSPVIKATIDKLFGGLGKAYDAGAPPAFNQSLFTPAGAQTQQAWGQGSTFANGLLRGGGLNATQRGANAALGGISRGYGQLGDNNGLTSAQQAAMTGEAGLGGQYGGLADWYSQDAPGYSTLRSNLSNDALSSVNSVFNNSGRFGGGSNVKAAGEGVTNALAGLDYQNFQNDANNRYRSLDAQRSIFGDTFNQGQTGVGNQFGALAGQTGIQNQLFNNGQQAIGNQQGAIASLGSIGAARDANQQGILQGQYDLFNRKNNNQLDWLSRLGSTITGSAGAGGSTTTSTQPATPWWQSILGLGISGLGALA